MDEQEHETLDNIENQVQESAIEIGRIDERTKKIEKKVGTVNKEVEENRQSIDELDSKVKRNSTVINGVTVGGSAVLLWMADKVSGLF